MSANNLNDIKDLLGLHPSSEQLLQYLTSLANPSSTPEVKSYSDAVYFNYYELGLSLLFSPIPGYKPSQGLMLSELNNDKLVLDSIDVYNIPKPSPLNLKGTSVRIAELAFSSFPLSPLVLDVEREGEDMIQTRPAQLIINRDTTGKDFVGCLGEPHRKGGGEGPSSGSIGIWCEWSKDGVMIEFGGNEVKGPQAWERGKDAIWKVITLFSSADK